MARYPSVAPGERLQRLATYRQSRRRGVEWLLAQMNRDGSIGDPSTGFSGRSRSSVRPRPQQPSAAGFGATS